MLVCSEIGELCSVGFGIMLTNSRSHIYIYTYIYDSSAVQVKDVIENEREERETKYTKHLNNPQHKKGLTENHAQSTKLLNAQTHIIPHDYGTSQKFLV